MEADYTLLETTLAMFNAEKYLPNFKKFGVDSTTLTLLTDEDLKVIGVVEEELRSKFIKQCSNLPLLLDSRLDLTVNEKYLMTALHQVDQHLLMLDASLTYALKRKNIQMCDVKLSKASKCLISCTNSLQNELINFHHIFSPKKKNEVNRRKIALLCITSAAATALVFKRYFTAL